MYPDPCDRVQLWRETHLFHVDVTLQFDGACLAQGFLPPGSWCGLKHCKESAISQRHVQTHAPCAMLMFPHSPSVLSFGFITFSSPLFWEKKKITIFAKRLHHHVIIIKEARPFRNLILQEHFENSNQKTFMRNWRKQELVKKSFLKILEFEKTNSNNLHEWERPIGPYFVVLPVLLAPSALCQSLPAGASSFFPCYFWIHLFQFPKDRT